MATTVAGSAMAGGGGFVLKSIRANRLTTTTEKTFSVQNEGDFCIISNDFSGESYRFYVSRIDDIPAGFDTYQSSLVFGKNITVKAGGYDFPCHIFEYGPAE